MDPERDGIWGSLVYPVPSSLGKSVPERVRKIYNEASKVKSVSATAFAILARRVLEEICADRGVKTKNLADGLKALIANGDIPKTLAEATDLIRLVGNMGAHASDTEISQPHVWAVDGFIKAIIEYIYVAPEKIKDFKKKLGLLDKKAIQPTEGNNAENG